MSALGISDHALLRFLDRAADFGVEELRTRLAQSLERAHHAARSVSGADYLIKADGLVYVVRGETVTTVLVEKTPIGLAATLEQRRQ